MQTPLIVFNARLKARRPRTATLTYVALVVAEPDMVVVDDLGAAVTHRSLIDVVTIASPGLHSLPDDAAPLTPGIDRPRRSLFNTLSGLRGHRARPGRECGGPRTGGPPASKEQAEGVAVGVTRTRSCGWKSARRAPWDSAQFTAAARSSTWMSRCWEAVCFPSSAGHTGRWKHRSYSKSSLAETFNGVRPASGTVISSAKRCMRAMSASAAC